MTTTLNELEQATNKIREETAAFVERTLEWRNEYGADRAYVGKMEVGCVHFDRNPRAKLPYKTTIFVPKARYLNGDDTLEGAKEVVRLAVVEAFRTGQR